MRKKVLLLSIFLVFVSAFLLAEPLDRNTVNSFDRPFMFEYNKTLDKTATALDFSLLLTPSIIALGGNSQISTLTVMYAETILSSWAIKEVLKNTIERSRPYMYYDNPPIEEKDKWNKSFPSGHTTIAFAAASFTSFVFSKYYPDSKWKLPLEISLYTIAGTTAVLRVLSGNHFVSDVLSGALIGTLCGIGIPLLHTINTDVSISPFSLAFKIGW